MSDPARRLRFVKHEIDRRDTSLGGPVQHQSDGRAQSVTQLKLPARFWSIKVVDAVEDCAVGKCYKVLPKVLDALRLGDALEVFTDGVPANKCPTEVVLLVFVIEVVPLGRFKSSDRRRVEVIWISRRSDGNGARCGGC